MFGSVNVTFKAGACQFPPFLLSQRRVGKRHLSATASRFSGRPVSLFAVACEFQGSANVTFCDGTPRWIGRQMSLFDVLSKFHHFHPQIFVAEPDTQRGISCVYLRHAAGRQLSPFSGRSEGTEISVRCNAAHSTTHSSPTLPG